MESRSQFSYLAIWIAFIISCLHTDKLQNCFENFDLVDFSHILLYNNLEKGGSCWGEAEAKPRTIGRDHPTGLRTPVQMYWI